MNSLARPVSRSETGDAVLAEIVEEVTNKFQAGEVVDVERYVDAHPELADPLRQLLPALHVLAELGQSAASGDDEPHLPTDVRCAGLGELGDFRLIREVGRGGMGVVYEAEQISLNRRVALKVLPFAATLDTKQLQRFKNEAQAAAHLHHTHIVPVYAVGCERGVHYYAMQYIDGQTLAAVIRELRENLELRMPNDERMTKDQCRSPKDHATGMNVQTDFRHSTLGILSAFVLRPSSFFHTVAQLGIQAAEALEHAHQVGIIHRDIKPANLLIEWRTEGVSSPVLWITDFGLAHCQSQAGLTMTGDLVGTLRYMSPEQALAKRSLVDHRTDIYSLGATLYELLTLEPAHGGSDREELLRQIAFEEPRPPRQWNKRIPRELETVVLKMMEKNPEARYATAQELADDLRRFLEDKPIRAKRPTSVQRAAKWGRRHPTFVWAAVLLLTAAMIGSAVSTFLIMQQRDVAQANANRAEQILDTAYRSMDTVFLAWAEKRLPQEKELTAEDRQFLEKELTFYVEFANQNSSRPNGRLKTAQACLRVANIQAQLGQDAEAKGNYRRSLEALRKLAEEFPDVPEYRFTLARCLSEMAFMSAEAAARVHLIYHPLYFDTLGEIQDAFREAVALQEKLLVPSPG